MIRRLLLTLTLMLPILAVGAPALADGPPAVTASDHVMGRADAPVTVIEYGSLVCPHCATWEMGTMPAFKARFIDTGRVRFVFRDMLTPPADVAATAAAIAHCSAPDRYFEVIHTFYLWQATAQNYGPMSEWYDRAIAASGRSAADVQTCVENPATLARIRNSVETGRAAGVQGTPSFFVNGRKVEDISLEGLAAAIDAAPTRR